MCTQVNKVLERKDLGARQCHTIEAGSCMARFKKSPESEESEPSADPSLLMHVKKTAVSKALLQKKGGRGRELK